MAMMPVPYLKRMENARAGLQQVRGMPKFATPQLDAMTPKGQANEELLPGEAEPDQDADDRPPEDPEARRAWAMDPKRAKIYSRVLPEFQAEPLQNVPEDAEYLTRPTQTRGGIDPVSGDAQPITPMAGYAWGGRKPAAAPEAFDASFTSQVNPTEALAAAGQPPLFGPDFKYEPSVPRGPRVNFEAGAAPAPQGWRKGAAVPAMPAEALAAAGQPKAYGRDLASVMARAGTPLARQAMEGKLNLGPEVGSLEYLRQESKKGNQQAASSLQYLAQHPNEAAMMYGKAPFEREADEMAEDRRRFDAGVQERQAGRSEQARQFDASLAQQKVEAEATAKYKNTMAEIEKQRAEGQITMAQARLAMEKAQNDAANEISRGKLAIDQQVANFQTNVKPQTPEEKAKKANELKLQTAQTEKAVKDLEKDPQKANLITQVNNEAAALIQANPDMAPEEARKRAFDKYASAATAAGVTIKPEEITVPEPYEGTATRELAKASGGAPDKLLDEALQDALSKSGNWATRTAETLSPLSWVPGTGRLKRFAFEQLGMDPRETVELKARMIDYLIAKKGMGGKQAAALVEQYSKFK